MFKNRKTFLASLWFLFTTALGSWWVYFSVRQYSSLKQTSWEHAPDILRYQRMLVFEGSVFLLLVVIGGGSLIFYFSKENSLLKERESFFAAFTHDLKTTIATHRLRLESMLDGERDFNHESFEKMLKESQTLGLKLENALLLSQADRVRGVLKNFKLSEVISSVKRMFPDLKISMNEDALLYGDKVFLTSVLMNLFQNAIHHAQATEIDIQVEKKSPHKVQVLIQNNGNPFQGDASILGQRHFYRGEYKGSGLGLFISRKLLQKMNADVSFKSSPQGLCAVIDFESGVKHG